MTKAWVLAISMLLLGIGCVPATDPKDLTLLETKLVNGMTFQEVEAAVGKPAFRSPQGGPSNEALWAYDVKGKPDHTFQVWFRDGAVFWLRLKKDDFD